MKILHLHRVPLVLSILSAALLTPRSSAADLFVDASLTTGAGDGSSWSNAFQGEGGVTAALAAAVAGDRVFVAQGTYLPSLTGARGASFVLLAQVELIGGFQGGESSPDERPPFGSAPTVLSGDLNGDDPASLLDNSFHVVRSTGNQTHTVLDGFEITGGYAGVGSSSTLQGGGLICDAGARPLIRNCEFRGNVAVGTGGACSIASPSAPTFIACRFVDNLAGGSGGAVRLQLAGSVHFDRCHFENNHAIAGGAIGALAARDLVIANSTFVGNTASGSAGGGALSFQSSATGIGNQVRNCTIVGNRSNVTGGGGIAASGTTNLTIANSILWGNQGPGASQAFSSQIVGLAPSVISYSIVEGIITGTSNQSVDPEFVDPAAGDFRVQVTSAAIDAGDNSAVPGASNGGAQVDLDGFRRFQDEPTVPDTGLGVAPIVDIGAFEYTTLIGKPFCMAIANSTALAARIDATGSTSVASNSVTLTATAMPQNVSGFFLTSRLSGHVPNAGGGSGTLCLGGDIGRFNDTGQILSSGTSGEFSLAIDLTMTPTPTGLVAIQPGETWRFQAWFRDSALGFATSNLTEGIAITFE